MKASDIANILRAEDSGIELTTPKVDDPLDSTTLAGSSNPSMLSEWPVQPQAVKGIHAFPPLEMSCRRLLDGRYMAQIASLVHAVTPQHILNAPSTVEAQTQHTLLHRFSGDENSYRKHFTRLLRTQSCTQVLASQRHASTDRTEEDIADPTAPWKRQKTPLPCALSFTGTSALECLAKNTKDRMEFSTDKRLQQQRQFEMEKQLDAAPYYTGVKMTSGGNSLCETSNSAPRSSISGGVKSEENDSIPIVAPAWSLSLTREQRAALHRIRHTVLSAEVLNSLLDKFSLVEGWKVFFQDVPPETMVECNGTQAGPYRSIIFSPLSLLSMKRCVADSHQHYLHSPLLPTPYCYTGIATGVDAATATPTMPSSDMAGGERRSHEGHHPTPAFIPGGAEGSVAIPGGGNLAMPSASAVELGGKETSWSPHGPSDPHSPPYAGASTAPSPATTYPPHTPHMNPGVHTSASFSPHNNLSAPLAPSGTPGGGVSRKRGSSALDDTILRSIQISPLPQLDLRVFDYRALTLADLDRMIWQIAANCVLFNAPETCYRATATEFATSCSIIIQDYCIQELLRQNLLSTTSSQPSSC